MTEKILQIAVFGESDVGKSHFGAQLIGRLNAESGSLRMRGAAQDLAAFGDVVQSLNEGLPGAHTAAGTYTETLLPIITENGVAVDLNWPDYAGEQVSQLLDERRIPTLWQKKVEDADGWILIVRPQRSRLSEDVFSRPLNDLQSSRTQSGIIERSAQSRLVELLQMLLYMTRSRAGKNNPAIAVILSCWDELQESEDSTPEQVLRRNLPLLAAFVRNNWDDHRRLVLGLSATGVALSANTPNEDFIFQGAEQMGWVINKNGERTPDLTLPIAQLAEVIQK